MDDSRLDPNSEKYDPKYAALLYEQLAATPNLSDPSAIEQVERLSEILSAYQVDVDVEQAVEEIDMEYYKEYEHLTSDPSLQKKYKDFESVIEEWQDFNGSGNF